jgi:hypothetical protein
MAHHPLARCVLAHRMRAVTEAAHTIATAGIAGHPTRHQRHRRRQQCNDHEDGLVTSHRDIRYHRWIQFIYACYKIEPLRPFLPSRRLRLEKLRVRLQ